MRRPSPETSHCRRPRISISWKLFAYLTLFTTFILIVVWVFQIGLLNYFYRQSKYRELDDAEKSLSQVLEQNPTSTLPAFGSTGFAGPVAAGTRKRWRPVRTYRPAV